MNDRGRTITGEGCGQRGRIEDVALHKRAPADECGMPAREVIERDRNEALRGERLAGMTADEAGAAGNEDVPAHITPSGPLS
jgi:hypothetical protein